jgi:hypothetical protein
VNILFVSFTCILLLSNNSTKPVESSCFIFENSAEKPKLQIQAGPQIHLIERSECMWLDFLTELMVSATASDDCTSLAGADPSY